MSHHEVEGEFEHLFQEAGFSEALQSYGELSQMAGVLDAHEQAIANMPDAQAQDVLARIHELRRKLSPRVASAQARLKQIASAGIQRQKRRAEMYLAEAHFALARLYDVPEGASP